MYRSSIKKVLRYMAGTSSHNIILQNSSIFFTSAYSDIVAQMTKEALVASMCS